MSPTLLHVEPVQRYLRGVLLCSVPDRGRRLALTFDDGPNPRNTPRLLDLLAARDVPATFFVVGRRLTAFPELARRAHHEGHQIESHGQWHLPLPLIPGRVLRRQVRASADAIERCTGRRPRYFRPPMGWFSHRCLRILEEEGLQPVIGNIHPEDSRRPSPDQIVGRIRERLVPGSIVILHDGGWRRAVDRTPTLVAVERLIDELRPDGWSFHTLSRLVSGDEPEGGG